MGNSLKPPTHPKNKKSEIRKNASILKQDPNTWNPPKSKILGVWLMADWTGCKEINYNNKYFE